VAAASGSLTDYVPPPSMNSTEANARCRHALPPGSPPRDPIRLNRTWRVTSRVSVSLPAGRTSNRLSCNRFTSHLVDNRHRSSPTGGGNPPGAASLVVKHPRRKRLPHGQSRADSLLFSSDDGERMRVRNPVIHERCQNRHSRDNGHRSRCKSVDNGRVYDMDRRGLGRSELAVGFEPCEPVGGEAVCRRLARPRELAAG
jgi:hypothetical protein